MVSLSKLDGSLSSFSGYETAHLDGASPKSADLDTENTINKTTKAVETSGLFGAYSPLTCFSKKTMIGVAAVTALVAMGIFVSRSYGQESIPPESVHSDLPDEKTTLDSTATTLEYSAEELQNQYNKLNHNIRIAYEVTEGTGSRGQIYVDDAKERLTEFLNLHPGFKTTPSENSFVSRDRTGGFASGIAIALTNKNDVTNLESNTPNLSLDDQFTILEKNYDAAHEKLSNFATEHPEYEVYIQKESCPANDDNIDEFTSKTSPNLKECINFKADPNHDSYADELAKSILFSCDPPNPYQMIGKGSTKECMAALEFFEEEIYDSSPTIVNIAYAVGGPKVFCSLPVYEMNEEPDDNRFKASPDEYLLLSLKEFPENTFALRTVDKFNRLGLVFTTLDTHTYQMENGAQKVVQFLRPETLFQVWKSIPNFWTGHENVWNKHNNFYEQSRVTSVEIENLGKLFKGDSVSQDVKLSSDESYDRRLAPWSDYVSLEDIKKSYPFDPFIVNPEKISSDTKHLG